MITGKASSFADPEDRRKFKAAKDRGLSDEQACAEGDPGIGWLDNDLVDERTPWVALPPDDWKPRFGSKTKAHRAKVRVAIGDQTHVCLLGDTMRLRKNIRNGAVIDLAPGAQKLFGLRAPFLLPCSWEWA